MFEMNLLNPKLLVEGKVLPILSDVNYNRFTRTEGLNFYKVVTEFYNNAMWGQLPRTNGEKEILHAFELSSTQRSINGYGAVLMVNDRHYIPDSRYLWRWEEDGILVGYVIGWPYLRKPDSIAADGIRIFIWQHDRELLTVQDWALRGTALERRLQQYNPPGRVAVWGNGQSDYPPMVDLVNWFNTRLKKNTEMLNRFANPHLVGPSEALDERGVMSLNTEEGSFLATSDKDAKDFSYLTWDANQPLNSQTVGSLLDALHMITGVPATAFGLQHAQGSGNSGVSRERQMFSALSKVRRLRRNVEDAMEMFNITEIAWPDDPFTTWQEQVTAELQLLAASIITPEEARERLNLGPPPAGFDPQQDREENEDQEENPSE